MLLRGNPAVEIVWDSYDGFADNNVAIKFLSRFWSFERNNASCFRLCLLKHKVDYVENEAYAGFNMQMSDLLNLFFAPLHCKD